MRSLCVCPRWPHLDNPMSASVLKRMEGSLVLKFLLILNPNKLLCTVKKVLYKVYIYMIALIKWGLKLWLMTAVVSFIIHISAALADNVCNKYLIRVANWVLVSLKLMAGLWLPDCRLPACRTGGHFGVSFLPARTMTAWRIKTTVTTAVSVESHSHLFVFHLVVHLCISMVSWTKTGDFFFFFFST